ncbi:lipase ROG1 family protein [Sporobolomyces koalae]|uniref:lipase ROG1 family protein n=1 Tax=Sporobolomyces koalae TaxID=500713 RepID=UPI00317683D7
MTKRPAPHHLLVVLHGLWGSPSHVRYIGESALKHAGPKKDGRDADGVQLSVLNAKLNEFTATYDGIDLCAERVLSEIDDEMRRIETEGGRVERFSIVGYSLGGLVARYVLGLLDSRSPSFFDSVKPMNFATFASPAIGIPPYGTFWSGVFRFLGARLLSRTGSQLYEHDRFLPSRFNPSSPDYSKPAPTKSSTSSFFSSRKREKAEPLLKILADPQFCFYRALTKFERVEVFANTVNDRTVPFPTGAFELHDPFALARAKARKVAETRGDDPDDPDLDLIDGGLELTLHEDVPIVSSYRVIAPTASPKVSRKRRFNLRLPLLLRPSTYPFSRPVSILVIAVLPVALPLWTMILIGRFLVQGRSSRRRIRELRRLTAGERGREGMLERVGVRLQEITEQVGTDNPDYAEDLSGDEAAETGTGDGDAETQSTRFERNNYGSTLESTPLTSGSSTPALLRGGSPPHDLPPSPLAEDSLSQEHHPEARKHSTDPIFTPSQLFQLHHLNALPRLRKHFVYLPKSRNSHGAIVRRSPEFEQHRIGVKVIDWWAKQFVL